MKIKTFFLLFNIAAICLVQTACQRSPGDFWEDTKSAGRHLGQGVRTLSGSRAISKQVNHPGEFYGPNDHEFIPLRDEDISNRLALEGGADQPMRTPGEAGSGLPGIDGFSCPTSAEQIQIFSNVHFETNEYAVRGIENEQIVMGIANYMKKHPNLNIFIEGHCDQRGPAAFNLALGAKRSNAIRNALIQDGVNPERIHTISYGKERPCVEGTDAMALKLNRRAEFKLYFQ
ncbi:MAG: OmpA family protein [Chlamydiales bacterium]|nr:OmpA family protein [Chlamydiales bacterium]